MTDHLAHPSWSLAGWRNHLFEAHGRELPADFWWFDVLRTHLACHAPVGVRPLQPWKGGPLGLVP